MMLAYRSSRALRVQDLDRLRESGPCGEDLDHRFNQSSGLPVNGLYLFEK